MSGTYGYFHNLLFREGEGRLAENCRLDLSKEATVSFGDSLAHDAGNAAGMLSTHLRRVNEILSDACQAEAPYAPSMEAISELAWTMDELHGLLDVLRCIEDLSEDQRKAAVPVMEQSS